MISYQLFNAELKKTEVIEEARNHKKQSQNCPICFICSSKIFALVNYSGIAREFKRGAGAPRRNGKITLFRKPPSNVNLLTSLREAEAKARGG